MTKVCMILGYNFREDIRVEKEAKTLVQHGFDVTVMARKDNTVPSFETRHGIKIVRVPVKRLLLGLAPRAILGTIGQRAQIYHAHDLPMLLSAFIAAQVNRAKLVYDSHELFLDSPSVLFGSKVRRLVMKVMERALIGTADAVITVNDLIANELERRYNIKRPMVVMNYSELANVFPSSKLRMVLNLDTKTKVVLYQGLMIWGRGLETLIDSARYLAPQNVVVLLGDGPQKPELIRRVEEADLSHKVKFLDRVPYYELKNYTYSADLGVVPFQNTDLNNYYGSPNKLFEYLMAGIPVAVSDFPVMGEIVRSSGAGEVFDPEDPRNIAQAINSILSDENRLVTLKKRARQAAVTKYNWQIESKKLLRLYNSFTEAG